MTAKVLVTGGAGFLGGHVCQALVSRGDEAVSFDVVERPGHVAGVTSRVGQISDLSALVRACREHEVDRIVHTVALQDSNDNPYATYLVNVLGAIHVMECVRLAGVERAVLVSSEAAYHATADEPMNEDHPVFSSRDGSPGRHYGASKAAADLIAMVYCSYDELDLRVVRLSSLYGPGMRAAMYIRPMIEDALAGRTTVFESGAEMRRDFTHVADAVQGILLALDAAPQRLTQRIYNICSGRTSTTAELADTVRRVIPTAEIQLGSGLSAAERSSIRTRGTLDIGAAKRDLGFQPTYDLETGVRDYVEYLQERVEH